jgi:hypothetical protein
MNGSKAGIVDMSEAIGKDRLNSDFMLHALRLIITTSEGQLKPLFPQYPVM